MLDDFVIINTECHSVRKGKLHGYHSITIKRYATQLIMLLYFIKYSKFKRTEYDT
jgi:hypothetical protein